MSRTREELIEWRRHYREAMRRARVNHDGKLYTLVHREHARVERALRRLGAR